MSTDNPLQPLEFIPPSVEHLAELLPAYQFESLVAKGGMGAVYKATQTSLDRPVAVKVLPPELGESAEFRHSFEKEAKLMARLNHPNLISVYDFGEIDGMLYIVMEFVDGATLYEKTYGGHLEQQEALEVTIAICDGLANAHEAGILHRDIKPANIFITENGTPKIGDFGLARPSGDQETGIIFGTPGYTAPEVISAPDQVGPATDVFAVGVMLYELLTGKLPGDLFEPVSKFTPCDPTLDDMIRKAIAANLQQRYQSAVELSEDLTELSRKLKKAPVTSKLRSPLATGAAATAATGQIKAASRPPASLPKKVKAGGGNGIKNSLIILVLLAGIYGALEWKKQREADIAQIEADNAKIEAANAKKIADAKTAAKPVKAVQKNAVKARKLSIVETLEQLKPRLLAGERPVDEMPKGIVKHDNDSRIILYIDKELTWQQADLWTQQYGGHLATVVSRDDLRSFKKAIPSGENVWIGAATAGNKQWAWLDGSSWNDAIEIRKTSKLAFAQIDRDLFASAKKYTDKATFLIEWKIDGSQPASIEERLKRVTSTLEDQTPVYPPGSVTFGSRAYYFCPIPLALEEANELAKSGGAHLSVPSDDVETIYLTDLIPASIPANQLCRIGGSLKGHEWVWLSGENWKSAAWDDNFPSHNDSLVISSGSAGKWQDASASDKVAYTLFEWSLDPESATPVKSNPAADFTKLQEKAAKFVNSAIAARDATYAENVKRLKRDLDSELKKLPKNEQARQASSVEKIKAILDETTDIDQQVSGMGTNSRIIKLTTQAYERQDHLSADFDKKVDRIRIAYLSNLGNLVKKLELSKQATAVKVANSSIASAQESSEAFIQIFD